LKWGIHFDLAGKSLRVREIELTMEELGFWDNADKAQGLMKELKNLKDTIEEYGHLKGRYEDVQTLIQMGYEENDESLIPEIDKA